MKCVARKMVPVLLWIAFAMATANDIHGQNKHFRVAWENLTTKEIGHGALTTRKEAAFDVTRQRQNATLPQQQRYWVEEEKTFLGIPLYFKRVPLDQYWKQNKNKYRGR